MEYHFGDGKTFYAIMGKHDPDPTLTYPDYDQDLTDAQRQVWENMAQEFIEEVK